jgi:hypothetical protein
MKEDNDLIKEYDDVELNRLIADCKNVTLTLSSMKIKKRTPQGKRAFDSSPESVRPDP